MLKKLNYKTIFYWFLITAPILIHLSTNIYFWFSFSDPQISTKLEELLTWIKFVWLAPFGWVLVNLAGLLQGPPKDLTIENNNLRYWNERNAILIIAYVSKGINRDTLSRSIQQTKQILDCQKVNYIIEIVTDKHVDISVINRQQASKTKAPIIHYVVPEDYRTKTNVKYKARALQYLLEQRTIRLNQLTKRDTKDFWVLHLDEESVITHQVIYGIKKFIRKYNLYESKGAIGQGEILYNSYKYGESILFTAADSIRTGDDLGRFRFQYKVLNKPIFGIHGSFILIPAIFEQKITWDSGARSNVTEDAYFALKAMEENIRFDWVDGFIKEQSPFTIIDFINQRSRWFCGLVFVATDVKLKFSTRFILALALISWFFSFFSALVTVISLLITFSTGVGYFPLWGVLATSLLSGFVGSIYMIGVYRNISNWVAPSYKKVLLILTTYFLFYIQILLILEFIAVAISMFRLVSNPPNEFYVVAKK